MRHDKCPILVFDPRGFVDMAITRMAQRKRSLEGLRLGILDNSKWNANKLLRGASVALGKDVKFAAINYYVKESFSKDAAPQLIEEIAERTTSSSPPLATAGRAAHPASGIQLHSKDLAFLQRRS